MQRDCEKLEALRRAVAIGEDQISHGEGILYTSARLETITRNALANAKAGKKVSQDVGPRRTVT